MKQLLMLDDHGIFRSGLVRLLEESGQINIRSHSGEVEQVLQWLRESRYDMMILDINLAGQNALELIPAFRAIQTDLPVLVMSMYPASQFGQAAFKAGATGYLSKDASMDELLRAIEYLGNGLEYRPAEMENQPDNNVVGKGYPHERLSDREMTILRMIADGVALTDIGARVFLSVKTVSTYRTRILEKLNLTNNAELVKYALTHGLTLDS
jgi:two-component system, NarL family, invasion response regulator UvrY